MLPSRWIGRILLLMLLAIPQHANAQAPKKLREFAWGATVFTGHEYNGVFSPRATPVMYLLANATHMLTGRFTLVYYWPIDHEYKPDWSSLNEDVDGTLEVLDQDGTVVNRLRHELYVIKPAGEEPDPAARLVVGTGAQQLYDAYQAEREGYLERVAAYDAQLEQLIEDGTPPSADRPPPFTRVLAPPNEGFALNLRPGSHKIRMLDSAGVLVPGSERTIVSVAPRRESVGYTVIPEAKWTVPEASNESSQVIYYSSRGTTVYLEPFVTREYNQREYEGLKRPQDTRAPANRWVWVQAKALKDVKLQVWAGGRVVMEIERRPYSVVQIPGAALGYEVVPLAQDPAGIADFEAFAVPAAPGFTHYTLQLVRSDGSPIVGAERTLVAAGVELPPAAYVLALTPLLAGCAVQWRRWRTHVRSMKALAVAGV